MRSIFNQVLVELARNDPRIYMVLADIGYGEIEPFAEAFPKRFVNCGVAEQNMAGVACGVALEGNIAVTYSIANFPTLRCLEQIRNDSCCHNANVKIVIIGGGLAYGALGVSHQATEDIAIMRALPNMVVVCPCDFAEAEAATRAMIAHPGPVFYRCGYKKEPPIHRGPINFQFGRAIQVRDGHAAVDESLGKGLRKGLDLSVADVGQHHVDAGSFRANSTSTWLKMLLMAAWLRLLSRGSCASSTIHSGRKPCSP